MKIGQLKIGMIAILAVAIAMIVSACGSGTPAPRTYVPTAQVSSCMTPLNYTQMGMVANAYGLPQVNPTGQLMSPIGSYPNLGTDTICVAQIDPATGMMVSQYYDVGDYQYYPYYAAMRSRASYYDQYAAIDRVDDMLDRMALESLLFYGDDGDVYRPYYYDNGSYRRGHDKVKINNVTINKVTVNKVSYGSGPKAQTVDYTTSKKVAPPAGYTTTPKVVAQPKASTVAKPVVKKTAPPIGATTKQGSTVPNVSNPSKAAKPKPVPTCNSKQKLNASKTACVPK